MPPKYFLFTCDFFEGELSWHSLTCNMNEISMYFLTWNIKGQLKMLFSWKMIFETVSGSKKKYYVCAADDYEPLENF